MCSGVTRHLNFWQNDCGLLRATAVIRGRRGGGRLRGGTDIEPQSAQKANSGEEHFLDAPSADHTRNLSLTSPALWWLFPRVRGFWENVRQFIPRLRFF